MYCNPSISCGKSYRYVIDFHWTWNPTKPLQNITVRNRKKEQARSLHYPKFLTSSKKPWMLGSFSSKRGRLFTPTEHRLGKRFYFWFFFSLQIRISCQIPLHQELGLCREYFVLLIAWNFQIGYKQPRSLMAAD